MMRHNGEAIPLQNLTFQKVEVPGRYSLENEDSFLSKPVNANKTV